MADLDSYKRELAQTFQAAVEQPEAPEGAASAFGMASLWGLVASRLIDMIEQIARELIEERINKDKSS